MKTLLNKLSPADRLLAITGALILIATVVFRISLLHLPIDRDEGEFAYAGWRMLHGEIPFRDFYNMKMPGIYSFYMLLFLFFGSSVTAIRVGLIIVNLANTFLVYRLAKKWNDVRTGMYAAIGYLVFSMQVELQGTNTHAESVAMMFVLSGLLIFSSEVSFKSKRRFFSSGVFLGSAFIIKQPAIAFIPLAITFILIDKFRIKYLLKDFLKLIVVFIAGTLLPFAVTSVWLIISGAGKNYFFFAFQYASEYASYLTFADGLTNFKIILSKAIAPNIFLWLPVPIGAVILFFQMQKMGLQKLLFFVFSFIAVSAGYYFRPHYFQFVIPASSMLAAVSIVSAEKFIGRKNIQAGYIFPFSYFLLFSVLCIYNESKQFSSGNEDDAIRKIYGQDFFNATKKAGEFIANHSSENSSVAIFGAEPEIWFYAKRKAASGYLYVYPLLEHQKYAAEMKQQFYDEIRKSRPEILVYTSNAGTWYASSSVHAEMFSWYCSYRDSSFHRIGLINIPYDSPTSFDLTGDTNVSLFRENYIEICRRSSE